VSVHAPGAVPNVEVTVEAFIEHVSEPLALELLAGRSGIHRTLRSARIQKPGLALAGYTTYVHNDRVQVLGQTELSYLHTLEPEPRRQAIESLLSLELACVLLTKGLAAPVELLEICERHATPLLRTPLTSSVGIRKVLGFLDDLLSPRTSMHGVLVDVDGVGVLLTGASGIGKSECALDLVLRGHRLVADDVVEIRRRGDDLVGQASNMIRNLIEIRGLGILNVADLYGVAATRIHKRIELHVELEMWRAQRLYDRIGLEERHKDVLGVPIPSLLIPVRPGRDIAAIVEVAARNALLRIRGHHAARDLNDQIETNLTQSPRAVDVMAQLEAARAGPTDLRRAAQLTELNDHIEDEVE
jgi:HPr kinase/phosphorylase